jgi:hypothetical protein
MNGWNRLFVVVAVAWTLVAPFLFVSESNKPADMLYSSCSHNAYELYGTGSSKQLDWDRYKAEGTKCLETFGRNAINLPGTLDAMTGLGDWKLGGAAWGFILIPLALLWLVGWGLGSLVQWIAAGFRRQRP